MRKANNVVAGIMGRGLVVFAVCCSPAFADVVEDWNRVAVDTVLAEESQPANAARNLATVHLAMFEAMNFVEGGYVPRFLVKPPKPSAMSSQAVAAAAAHHVLTELYPRQKTALDAALRLSVTSLQGSRDHVGALISGAQLAAIVRATRNAKRFSQVELASLNGSDATQDAIAWARTVSGRIGTSRQTSIERSRVYALAALAVDEAYAYGLEVESQYGLAHPCVSCTADTAIEVILTAQVGATRAPSVAVASAGSVPRLPASRTLQTAETDAAAVRIAERALGQYPSAN